MSASSDTAVLADTSASLRASPATSASSSSTSVASSSSTAASVAASSTPADPARAKPADPDMDHTSCATFQSVYEPAEDSYLLMDALYLDLLGPAHKRARLPPFPVCVEIGPGSGIVLSYLGLLLRRRGLFLAVDVNPAAARVTRESLRRNGLVGDVLQGNLADPLRARLHARIDVLVFNPPYVPTPPEELLGDGIERSWAGGERGREVLDQLLPVVQELLSPCGVFYLLLLRENDPEEVCALLKQHGGFQHARINQRRAGREDLQVVKFWRETDADTRAQTK